MIIAWTLNVRKCKPTAPSCDVGVFMAVCQQARNKESVAPKHTQLHTLLISAGWKLLFLNAKMLSSRSLWLESALRNNTKLDYRYEGRDLNVVFLIECHLAVGNCSFWSVCSIKRLYLIWEVPSWPGGGGVASNARYQKLAKSSHGKHSEIGGP